MATSPSRTLARARAGTGADAGVLFILGAVLLFAVYNAITKALSTGYDPLQIVFFRGLFGLLPVFWLLRREPGGVAVLRSRRPGWQLVRAGTALFANFCIIASYRSLPLADAVAIAYSAPIFVTALSVPLLSERVGAHRWSAVLVGFCGVLLVARPGIGVVHPAALLAIVGTVSYALSIIATRRLAAHDATICTMAHSTGFYVLATAVALPFVWITPDWSDLGLFLALGLVAGAGMFCFVQAYRFAEAATIAPFDYTAMAWAALLGYLIWGEVPSTWSFAGFAVIVASGLYIVHREAGRGRAAARP